MKHLWKYFLLVSIMGIPGTATAAEDDAFLIGWYLYDNPDVYETVSNPDHVVDHHGDPDLYFYEPSVSDMCKKGETVRGHGLIDQVPPDNEIGFCVIEQYILEKAGNEAGNVSLDSVFTYQASTTLATFDEATFTYAMVYLYIPEDTDPSLYSLRVHQVDDGIEVMTNARINGFMKLHDQDSEFDLDRAQDGAAGVLHHGFNTIVLILVDDSRVYKYIRNVEFLYDGQPDFVVVLEPNIVYGRVFDSYTLEPVAGATVTLDTQSQVTDDTGYYYFNNLPDGTHDIDAAADGYEPDAETITVEDASAFYKAFYLDIIEQEDGDADQDNEMEAEADTVEIEFIDDVDSDGEDAADMVDDIDGSDTDNGEADAVDMDMVDTVDSDVSPDGLIDVETGDEGIAEGETADLPDAIDTTDNGETPGAGGSLGSITGSGCNCNQSSSFEFGALLAGFMLIRRLLRRRTHSM